MLKIPKYVNSLFWENDSFDGDDHVQYVISRILEIGDDKQVDWMMSNYTKEQVVEVLKKTKTISQKSANYWSVYFGVDQEEVRCLKEQLPSRQNRFC